MSVIASKFNVHEPLMDILPKVWTEEIDGPFYNVSFHNLEQFKYVVSRLTQLQDKQCGMSYKEALGKLLRNESDFPKEEQESIRNLVRKNLFKRGLITQEVYEDFKYSTDGTQVDVDVGKYAAGEADCVITPAKEYVDFFYELYVNISYPYSVDNKDVRKNVAKLLATIEELERQHIFIKVNTVFPAMSAGKNNTSGEPRNFFSIIPLFSHKDPKSVDVMAAVINERLLRKFYFAILEDVFGSKLSYGYGYVTTLTKTLNIGSEFHEIEFFESVCEEVGANNLGIR